MPAPNILPAERLFQLVGRPDTPVLVDVRSDKDAAADPRLLPGASRKPAEKVPEGGPELSGRSEDLLRGRARSKRRRRRLAPSAQSFRWNPCRRIAGWRAAGLPLVPENRIPARDDDGATLWVTRARPKIDRIACPWLIRRFVDPARSSFSCARRSRGVADRFTATPFDIEGRNFLESSRRALHLRCDGRGVRSRYRADASARPHRACRRYRAA